MLYMALEVVRVVRVSEHMQLGEAQCCNAQAQMCST